jgi:hypothetical protein
MDHYLVKNAPVQIPTSIRKTIVDYAPVLALVGAAFSLIVASTLWRLAQKAQDHINAANELTRNYGIVTSASDVEYGTLFYVAFLMLIVQGVLMVVAYRGLRERSKRGGWDLLLLSVVVNFAFGFIYAFTDTGGFINLFTTIIASLVSLYILAQIRGQYSKRAATASRKA